MEVAFPSKLKERRFFDLAAHNRRLLACKFTRMSWYSEILPRRLIPGQSRANSSVPTISDPCQSSIGAAASSKPSLVQHL
eukprot:1579859-Amphidinium_carterae.1